MDKRGGGISGGARAPRSQYGPEVGHTPQFMMEWERFPPRSEHNWGERGNQNLKVKGFLKVFLKVSKSGKGGYPQMEKGRRNPLVREEVLKVWAGNGGHLEVKREVF